MDRPTKEWIDADIALTYQVRQEENKEYERKCSELKKQLIQLKMDHDRRSEDFLRQMNEWDNTVVYCECGGKYKHKAHEAHIHTKKHMTYLAK